MAKQYIQDLKVNDRVDSFFMLNKKNLKLTKYDKPYMELGLSDKTGKIEGRLWDNAEDFDQAVQTGDIVRVKGSVSKFKEDKQLKVDMVEPADDRAYLYEDMVRVAENREEIFNRIKSYLAGLKDPSLKALADLFMSDDDLIKAFMDGVGGKSWHNAYIGGLAEHTYEVMFITDKMCELYPDVNRDLAIMGAFLHDIGKVFELDPRKMEYTEEGGLLGHIAIGYGLLKSKIDSLTDFPDDRALHLCHIVLSHHGEYEQQSPVLPKTLEATIVYQVDELVSQANAVKEIRSAQAEEGRPWSNFVSIKNRKYYLKTPAQEPIPPVSDTARPARKDLFG
ncbi:MAG: HD domain-containing protein [Candidatus Omnitrophica bacterium]|nr:HD domain-containing protein [Candidatus Omnitrophota bacterium]MDD5488039.1 HD domain-containing protein [Candidatus Omnitrophota bacterium]